MEVWSAIGLGGAVAAMAGYLIMAHQARTGKLKLRPWAQRGRAGRLFGSPFLWLAFAVLMAVTALRVV